MVESSIQLQQKISVAEFINVAIDLVNQSQKIIFHLVHSKRFKNRICSSPTDEYRPLWGAQCRVMKTIIHNLNLLYPSLEIIGMHFDKEKYEHFTPAFGPE
jgi:hypothetical protein